MLAQIVTLEEDLLQTFNYKSAGFPATDYLLWQHCLDGDYRWFMVTNGDNWSALPRLLQQSCLLDHHHRTVLL